MTSAALWRSDPAKPLRTLSRCTLGKSVVPPVEVLGVSLMSKLKYEAKHLLLSKQRPLASGLAQSAARSSFPACVRATALEACVLTVSKLPQDNPASAYSVEYEQQF